MKTDISDILKLSIPEKIMMVETIWDNIAAENSKLKLSKEEEKLLDERLSTYRKNPERAKPLQKFIKELKAKRK